MTVPQITYNPSTKTFGPGDVGYLPTPGVANFILAEDQAIKDSLKGITVSDAANNTRPVGVWFGQPDAEIREQKFPYIVIDLLDVSGNKDQYMDSYGTLGTRNADVPLSSGGVAVQTFSPTPMLLTYQISSWARSPRHDRQILTALNHGVLHPRFAQVMDAATETNRRVVVQSFAKRDTTDENSKRVFRNVWTVQVVSEIFYHTVDLFRQVSTVTINSAAALPHTPPVGVFNSPLQYPR